jgi:predicted nucleic acid-binding protein
MKNMPNKFQIYLVDASVLVEIVKNRFKKDVCLDFLANLESPLFITILTVSIVWHYTTPENIELVKEFLDQFEILDLTTKELDLAYQIWQNDDLEDALQISSGLNNQISDFITLDKKLTEKYNDKLNIILI